MRTDQSPSFPSSVTVRFRGRRTFDSQIADQPPEYYIKKVTASSIGLSGFGSPATKEFHDSALALYPDATPIPSNQDTLDSLAIKIATDYYTWILYQFDRTFPKILNIESCSLYDELIFDYNLTGCTTRVRSPLPLGDPEQLMHHDPNNAVYGGALTPCVDSFVPRTKGPFSTIFDHFKICLVDGRLESTHIGQETVPCTCGVTKPCIDSPTITIFVYGCNPFYITAPLLHATVNLTGPGGFNQTLITDNLNTAKFTVEDNGVYTYTVTRARFQVQTGTVTITNCKSKTANVFLQADSAHACWCYGICNIPPPKTLFLTDSALGTSVALEYNDITLEWVGSTTYRYPGCTDVNGQFITVICEPREVTITYRFCRFVSGGFGGLQRPQISWTTQNRLTDPSPVNTCCPQVPSSTYQECGNFYKGDPDFSDPLPDCEIFAYTAHYIEDWSGVVPGIYPHVGPGPRFTHFCGGGKTTITITE